MMVENHPQMRPASPAQAPDPASSYERAKPEKEAGAGRMDNNVGTPARSADKSEQAVTQKQDLRQLNAQDVTSARDTLPADGTAIRPDPEQPDHSMHDEEPLGWDQAPTDIRNPRDQRQPKTDGKGGTP
ncbi:MAG TPA: hypothetical protein VLJ39_01670 [Tepidisphaeraceae bacterium]|nr:hypothetical protein [Tepidisphaeraceae bacterium]